MTENYDDLTATEVIDATEAADQTAVEAPASPEPDQPDQPDQPDEPEDTDTGNKEAAKYRRRLRETESERDQMAERLATMQRAEVERLVSAELTVPAGLWASGVQLADLLDEAGNVDAEKVTEAARNAVSELGLESPRAKLLRGNVVPREGNSPKHHQGSGWEAAFSLSQG